MKRRPPQAKADRYEWIFPSISIIPRRLRDRYERLILKAFVSITSTNLRYTDYFTFCRQPVLSQLGVRLPSLAVRRGAAIGADSLLHPPDLTFILEPGRGSVSNWLIKVASLSGPAWAAPTSKVRIAPGNCKFRYQALLIL
jgi:hypothetical protein